MKKTSAGFFLLLVFSLLVVLLLILYLYDEQKQRKTERSVDQQEEVSDGNLEEGFILLEKERKEEDFPWPSTFSMELLPVVHKAYSLGFYEEHGQAAWVAYLLSSQHQRNSFERRNNFREDPLLEGKSASPEDYTNSGYDRGHLAPAGDLDYSKNALAESFYMSNISPQEPSFNRGGWKELEDLIRTWATLEDSLLIVTGPVLQPGLKKIGRNKVSVPEYFYKIIFDTRQPEVKMIGFLMPNRGIREKLDTFIVPVDSIEKLTGLDFFPGLSGALEDSLEDRVQKEKWF
ncbi:DNA/RNA non-specific endonuclease [Nafulsella turpanensis]|uniref:DNA/RNA non-specific endonuclease n=1 Tax=Nafulsella turpanensis TaxID=1265690 RepID=UPI0003667D9F|nr:DNA/RNA non-specific endonuclease [Nafulsella turpanensis]